MIDYRPMDSHVDQNQKITQAHKDIENIARKPIYLAITRMMTLTEFSCMNQRNLIFKLL